MIKSLLIRAIMWLLHVHYKELNAGNKKYEILYIKGTGKHYPRYCIYTEDPKVYNRMDDF